MPGGTSDVKHTLNILVLGRRCIVTLFISLSTHDLYHVFSQQLNQGKRPHLGSGSTLDYGKRCIAFLCRPDTVLGWGISARLHAVLGNQTKCRSVIFKRAYSIDSSSILHINLI